MYTPDNSKRYTGTKTLAAWPATRGEYNAYRGWTTPAGEDPEVKGYIVEYEEGGNPNHPNHAGYISWSPADVFERAYSETPGDWLSRAEFELAALRAKLARLTDYLAEDGQDIPVETRGLLVRQEKAMQEYADVLAARIPERGKPE